MRNYFLIVFLLFASLTANSQITESKQFLDIFKSLKTSDNQPIKCDYGTDEIQKRLLFEYGAVYVSKNAKLPPTCRFTNETEIAEFIKTFKIDENKFSFGDFYLQTLAKKSLEQVFRDSGDYQNVARNGNKTTTTTNGINDDWALRTYAQTQVNWKISFKKEILPFINDEIDKKGNFLMPKMFSTAIPGGSQHHLGLAIDVDPQKCKAVCQENLKKEKWFRTVRYDPSHFTYLGYEETELPNYGLRRVVCGGVEYWIPNVNGQTYSGYKFVKGKCK